MDADPIDVVARFDEEIELLLDILLIESYPGFDAERHLHRFAQCLHER